MNRKTIIFVHPALWGGNLIAEAKKLGFLTFAIITTFENTRIKPEFLDQNCDFVLYGSSNPEKDLSKIKKIIAENSLEISAILNGIDASIYYTDFLQKEILNYPIDLEASKIRLNKYAVNHSLKENDLPTIPSIQIKSLMDLENNLSTIKTFGLPLLIKPAENTASRAGVKIAKTISELRNQIQSTLGASNAYYKDRPIDKLVIQKYLFPQEFTEFAFDCISFAGQHRCIGILEYWKNDVGIVEAGYPRIKDELSNLMTVINYVYDCLNALKVSYGLTHIEVFWNKKNNEYYVIEVNNRYAGFPAVPCYYNIYKNGPLKTYFHLMDKKHVENIPNHRVGYSIFILLYNFHVDYPKKINLDQIQSKVAFTIFRASDKKKLPINFYKKYDLPNQVGAVIVLHGDSEEQLLQDFHILKTREKKGGLFF